MTETYPKIVDLAAAVAALEKDLGFRSERTHQIVRRLREAGMIPAGRQGFPSALDLHDFGTILLACAAGGTIAEAPERVSKLDQLVPGGIDASDFPEQMRKRMAPAGVDLDTLLQMAAEGDDCLRLVRIEICSDPRPEYAVAWLASGDVKRWFEPGTDPNNWGAGHRRATTIDGKALFYCVQALFGEQAAHAAA